MSKLVQELDAAKQELLRLKVIVKPRRRIRRLKPEEEAALREYFGKQEVRAKVPMLQMMSLALLLLQHLCQEIWEHVPSWIYGATAT